MFVLGRILVNIKQNNKTSFGKFLTCGASVIAMAAVSAVSAPVLAQETTAESGNTASTNVVVVGTRRALKNAQQIKKDSDTVVDSISASDIGVFPDKSVAEALQRVAGVTVERFAAKNDVAHFSAEPSGVTVRGLQQVRSEFNGRDTFSATSSYGLSWSDVSPELMGGVDVYKNLTADLIEGGIAGTVNLRTRLPFDQKERVAVITAQAEYGDLVEETKPSISGIFADRFDTKFGEFGFMINGAYSEASTNSQGILLPRATPFAAGLYGPNKVYIPSGVSTNDNTYNRTREGYSAALQWQNNERTMLATLQFNKSSYTNTWNENTIGSSFFWVDPGATNHSTVYTNALIAPPVGGAPFQFDENGMFKSGVITSLGSTFDWANGGPNIDWGTNTLLGYPAGSTNRFGNHALQHGVNVPLKNPCLNGFNGANGQPLPACRYGVSVTAGTRFSDETRNVQDVSFNYAWNVTPKLKLSTDIQYIEATTENYDVSIGLKSYANLDLDLTGKYPVVKYLAPTNVNLIGTGLSDARNYAPEWIMDHITDSKGTQNSFRIDADYKFEGTWLNSIRGGFRTAEREQKHQWSNYNWQSVATEWNTNSEQSLFIDSGPSVGPAGLFQGYEPGSYATKDYGSNFFGGGVITGVFPFITDEIMSSREELAKRFSIRGQTDAGGVASSNWNPICERPTELANSCFTAAEILDVKQTTNAAYLMLKFGGNDAHLFGSSGTFSGNVGLRYVENTTRSSGGLNFASPFTASSLQCTPLTQLQIDQFNALNPPVNGVTFYPTPIGCLTANSIDDINFSLADSILSVAESTHEYFLPSFNIKYKVNDKLQLRFAASRGMSFPEMGLLRNFSSISRGGLVQTDVNSANPNLVFRNGQPYSYKFSYTGQTGNARLKAVTADNIDFTVENYFAAVGSVTFNAFYKQFYDYIQNGRFIVPVTHNGVTRDVRFTGPVNGEGASLKGFEIAFQRYFDFLPGNWSGLGIQANFTHVMNSGIENAGLTLDTADGGSTAGSEESGAINPGRLEGMSDNYYNIAGMYDKGKWSIRAAYNWRSKYLVTVNDCCLGLPVWNGAQGFLDGSIRYDVSPKLQISLQGSNLLGTETKVLQQIEGSTDADPDKAPLLLFGGVFKNDRRLQMGIRYKF